MDLRQLRQFVAVAEERSFRRAAERLHVSQPPLSVAVQRLEKDIGVTLLERSRAGVRLTAAGEAFLEEARRTLSHAHISVEIAQRAALGKLGTLRLSFVPSSGLTVIPQLLREFRKEHPDVKLLLSSETTVQQVDALLRGSSDVGMVVPPLDSRELRVQIFSEEDLVLAVPANHPFAGMKHVQLRDTANESFIGFAMRQGPGFESVVLAACRECGFIPRFDQVAGQMQSIVALVAGGMGVALVPHSMHKVVVDNVRYLKVRNRQSVVRYALGFAYRPASANPALAAFLAMADRLKGRLKP